MWAACHCSTWWIRSGGIRRHQSKGRTLWRSLGNHPPAEGFPLHQALRLLLNCSDSSCWAACRKEVARWEWGRGIPNPRSKLPCTEITYIARTLGPRRRDFAGSAMCAGRNPPGVSRQMVRPLCSLPRFAYPHTVGGHLGGEAGLKNATSLFSHKSRTEAVYPAPTSRK